MPDESTPTTPQAGNEGQPQAGNGTTPEQSGQEPQQFDAAYVQQLRNENAKHRREAAELAKWKQQREQQEMSESERTAARLKEFEAKEQGWERERRDLRLQTAITAAATKAGALNPEILHRLVDGSAVEWNDETGQPKNLTAVVNELKREYPAMFRTHGGAGSADAGAGNGGNRPEQSMNSLIRRAAGRE